MHAPVRDPDAPASKVTIPIVGRRVVPPGTVTPTDSVSFSASARTLAGEARAKSTIGARLDRLSFRIFTFPERRLLCAFERTSWCFLWDGIGDLRSHRCPINGRAMPVNG